MPHHLLAALLVASATATAQTPAPGTKPAAPAPAAKSAQQPQQQPAPAGEDEDAAPAPAQPSRPAAPAGQTAGQNSTDDVDAKIAAAKEEMRQEITAQLATQSTSEEWNAEFVTQQKKLELFTLDGYLRLRPTLYYKFDLGKDPTAGRNLIWPNSPRTRKEQTQAGANMRVRLEPTFNVSEEVRIKMQVDALDNVLLGSTPDTAFTSSDRNAFTLFSESQSPPTSGVNALKDSILVRRAYGEVSTPVGILRFGRMGSHWGLGMLRNDGNCLDCDFGDTVDRIQFVTEPFNGWYVTPMFDFNSEGLTSEGRNAAGEPYDLTQSDDAHSLVLAVARRDTEQQVKAKLADGQGVLNYGLHFTYRTQRWDTDYGQGDVNAGASGATGFIPRKGRLFVPDFWLRYEQKSFRLEMEAAAQLGDIENRALDPALANVPGQNQSLSIVQFGAVVQAEAKLMKNALSLGLELGYASGDDAPGFGNYPRRQTVGADGTTVVLTEPQFDCTTRANTTSCDDRAIRNFRFNRDYRVDMILWREILGGLTDAIYAKPTLKYTLAPGFDLHGSLIYSRAVFKESTPSFFDVETGKDLGSANLGVEFNAGVRYETEDGFISGLDWGILFPLSGLEQAGFPNTLKTPQALRAMLGIKF
ncbi:TIGR04551 family protein [Aggregicoccus sp. 17bor-14]|uniref:TIGR04551 family protein n=1 Tax=Myxococcaceae TaxID=31 RepID=UPI00129CA3C4|nr:MULTISPECIES: TIGR04551 family protein [Myxococcaceae]MBF5044584.1 TIGR04551 family protein [Simulacricoccus sp. 17bor-14]MRI90328.1 TIGR04551 family protein [Aggregicoccus sp. 17bor-14]